MSNRAQRRSDKKKLNRYQRMTPEQQRTAMIRNGITPKDLQEAYDKGYAEGVKRATDISMNDTYAGFLLAAHEVFGFGRERCKRLLYAADERITYSLSSDEAIKEVFDMVGVTIDFYDPQRITEVLEED